MYYIKKLLLVFLFISNNAIVSFSQLKFDFENGISDWQQNVAGRWEASSANPINGNYSLHHAFDNSSSSHDQISYFFPNDIDFETNVSWTFKIKHDYNPSSSNNWAVFLCANKSAIEMYPGSLISAYVVGVNYTGSDDLIKLWKIENGITTVVIESTLNWETEIGDTATLIRVERSSTGNWNIKTAKDCKTDNLISVGSAVSEYTTDSKYFGVYYEYSSSQDMKFYLDDVEIDALFISDTSGPEVDSIAVSGYNVDLWFNEAIDTASAIVSNFVLNPGQIKPYRIDILSDQSVELKFSNFINQANYNLTISGIKDLRNNQMTSAVKEISFYLPTAYDILITEIMVDPDPPVSLPNYEYLELYNNSDFDINLYKWILQSGDNSLVFPAAIIKSNEYLIVGSKKAESTFNNISKSIGLWTDAYFLNNSEGLLILKEPSGKLISYAYYNSESCDDDFKANGGWSLEMKNLKVPCGDETNLGFSVDNSGGTPGKSNSISDKYTSGSIPEHLFTLVPDDTTIILHWSNMPDFSFIQDTGMFMISSTHPQKAELSITNFPSTKLKVAPELISEEKSFIMLKEKLFDCSGTKSQEQISIPFAKPKLCDSFDVVINEILYSPYNGGSEFVELYNRSHKIIDAGSLIFATLDTITGKVKSFCKVADEGFLFFPSEYILLTDNLRGVAEHYEFSLKSALVNSSFPSLLDDYGTIAVINKQNRVVDKLTYSEKMHFSLLRNYEGVSLERINPDWPTQSYSNWHSASQITAFATPGFKNSQTYSDSATSNKISISPEVFSPDNDGNEDFLTLKFNAKPEDRMLTINIYNSSGKLIRHLLRNQLLGAENSFTWDGTSDSNRLQASGIYIIYIAIQSDQGKVAEFKKTCVLRR